MGLLNKFRNGENKRGLEEEVVGNLSSLLNTKATFGAWQKGMGLKSYACNKSNLTIVNEIIDDIVFNIEQYEKRMKVLAVRVVNNTSALTIRFQIDSVIGEEFHSFYLGFKNYPEPVIVEVENGPEDEH